jgi:ATP-dependent Clp protease ATP-binding subunit ClpC
MDPARLSRYAAPDTLDLLEGVIRRAAEAGVAVTLGHVLDGALARPEVAQRWESATLTAGRAALAVRLGQVPAQREPGRFGFDFARLFDAAIRVAQDAGNDHVTPIVLLTAGLTEGILRDPESRAVLELLRARGFTVESLVRSRSTPPRADFTYAALGFGTDVTAKMREVAGQGCPLVGMEDELRRLVARIAGGSESIVLVGEPGVGKSALVEGLAWHIACRTRPLVPSNLDNLTVVEISVGTLLADTGNRGALEKKIEELLSFFAQNRNVVPFFDEIHTLLDVNEAATRGIANALKPPLANGSFRCLGATTDQEYARFIASDRALKSRFTPITVPEPTVDEATIILERALPHLVPGPAREAGIQVDRAAVRRSVELTSRYQRSDRLPRKAIRLLRSSLSEKTYRTLTAGETPMLTPDDVARTFSEASGIPVVELSEDGEDYAGHLASQLGRHVRGQNAAVTAVSSWLQLHRWGWTDPRRPRGRFLFLGPPGVGKTELAQAIAAEVLHDAGSVVVKNMAEFKGEGARSRFMGADPGYVGFGTTETVYARVLMRPFSVVVLDEIEKAHASLADPLLSVLDGAAEDGSGRWVDFSQCVFCLTSNAIQVAPDLSNDEAALRETLKDIGGIFTPPMVDRLDRVVLFRPLDLDALAGILDLLIERRRKAAGRPLPAELDQVEVRARLLDDATRGSAIASARGLERALAAWLQGHATARKV